MLGGSGRRLALEPKPKGRDAKGPESKDSGALKGEALGVYTADDELNWDLCMKADRRRASVRDEVIAERLPRRWLNCDGAVLIAVCERELPGREETHEGEQRNRRARNDYGRAKRRSLVSR